MTKSEEKLLELLLEKVEALESEVEELKSAPSGGTVVHNHYHSHYHGRTWNNWPYYGYPYTVWNSSGATPAAGGATYTVQSGSGGSSKLSGGSYSLAASTTSKAPSNTASAIDFSKLENAAEIEVYAIRA